MKKLLLLLCLGMVLSGCGPSEDELNRRKEAQEAQRILEAETAAENAKRRAEAEAEAEAKRIAAELEAKRIEAEAAQAAAEEAERIARYYDIKIDCASMIKEVRANEVRATSKFSNKLILITGVVENISEDGIELNTSSTKLSYDSCTVANMQWSTFSSMENGSALWDYAATLNKGDRVSVKCGEPYHWYVERDGETIKETYPGKFYVGMGRTTKLGGCSPYPYD